MITWRLLTPEEVEEYDRRCDATRGRRGRVHCEQPPEHPGGPFHVGRDRLGRWHTWPMEEVTAA